MTAAEAEFDAFVAGSGRRLVRTAYLLTGDHGAAEDLVQDVLVRAWSRWSRVSGVDEPDAHVRRMLVRASVSRWQALRAARRAERPVAEPLVATLAPRQRAVVVLCFYEDLPDAQVADALGCPTDTVHSQRAKALRTMGTRIDQRSMSHDLESRVRTELVARAGDVGPLPAGGAALRETARRRRAAALRAGAAAVAAVGVLGVGAAALAVGGQGSDGPVGRPTATSAPVSTTQPDPAWLQVPLTDDMYARALTATGDDSSRAAVVSARIPGSERVVVALAVQGTGTDLRVSTTTFESDRPGAAAVSGTAGTYPSYSSLIAQPVRDGDQALLLVLLPPHVGDTVEATSSVPGRPLRRTSAFVSDRLALVPVTSPESVTRVRVLREGRPVVDTVPAGSLLDPDVPRTLQRVVATAGPPSQPVQVRTDGRTACRLTVGGWWEGPAYVPWNPFDSGCAQVDGSLHLLLAADRRYSSVAGVAPPGTTSVRLYWRSGDDNDVTDVPVTVDGGVTAFIDTSGHRPDNLLRAEATRFEDLIATALP